MSNGIRHTMHVVGGGVMGLMAAIELVRLARRLGVLNLTVRLYERGAFGGPCWDDRTAAPRSQCWLHLGQLYAQRQPDVCLYLRRYARRLVKLVRDAFEFPLALVIEPPGQDVHLGDFYAALGVRHRELPLALVHSWFDKVKLPPGSRVYRVDDATIDLRLLASGLVRHAKAMDIELCDQGVDGLDLQDDAVRSLLLTDGEEVPIGHSDQLILAAGAGIRPLLARVGLAVPGLKLFQSHLVATHSAGLSTLLVVYPLVNCIPHSAGDGGFVNVFGGRDRRELPPETDDEPIRVDPQAVETICSDVKEWFGIKIPADDRRSWAGVKTEITDGARSQKHHFGRVPGLTNTWYAIPGKLSQAAGCGHDLACKVVQEFLTDQIAQSIWERHFAEELPDAEGRSDWSGKAGVEIAAGVNSN